MNVLTVKKIIDELYILLDFEHYITKKRRNGFFKSSLFLNCYPKMLIDFYESYLRIIFKFIFKECGIFALFLWLYKLNFCKF